MGDITKNILNIKRLKNRFRSTHGVQRAIGSTFIFNLAIHILGIATGIMTARVLGPQGKGEITALVVWFNMMVWLVGLNVGTGNIYFIAKEPERKTSLFINSLWIAIIIGLPALVIVQFLVPILFRTQQASVVSLAHTFMLLVPVAILGGFNQSLLQGSKRFHQFNVVRLIGPLTYLLCLTGFFIAKTLSVSTAVLSNMCSYIIAFVLALVYMKDFFRLSWVDDFPLMKGVLGFGLKSYLGGLTAAANKQLDKLLMVAFLSASELGLYSVAANVTGLVQILIAAVAIILQPTVAGLELKDGLRLMRETLAISSVILLVAVVLLVLMAPFIIGWLYGAEFLGALSALQILAVGRIFFGLATLLLRGFQGLGYPLYSSYAEVVGLVVMAVCLWILLPKMGIVGAAWSATIGNFGRLLVGGLLLVRLSYHGE